MPAMPPCQGKEKETRTRLSTDGTTKSRRSVRSATKQGGYYSGLKESPPSLNWLSSVAKGNVEQVTGGS